MCVDHTGREGLHETTCVGPLLCHCALYHSVQQIQDSHCLLNAGLGGESLSYQKHRLGSSFV